MNAPRAENSNDEAKALAGKLKSNYTTNIGNNLNHYQKVEHSIPANTIEGKYKGYIIKYDWSGEYAINSSSLLLEINYTNGELVGTWTEDDSIHVPLKAILTPSAMVFDNTQYSRTDHYSLATAIPYKFTDAKLQWTEKSGTVYLTGNIQMFSPKRNEPEKPLFISLTRSATVNDNFALINLVNDDGSSITMRNNLTVYPNPFSNTITAEFKLGEKCLVETDLLTLEGKLIYKNTAGILEPGNYVLPLQPQQKIAPGTYMIELHYGKNIRSAKVIKL